jgi:hypothetical protein
VRQGDLEDKFMTLAEPVLGEARSVELARHVWAIEAESDIRAWMRLCQAR